MISIKSAFRMGGKSGTVLFLDKNLITKLSLPSLFEYEAEGKQEYTGRQGTVLTLRRLQLTP